MNVTTCPADAPSAMANHWRQAKHLLGIWTSAACAAVQPAASRGSFGILMYHRLAEPVRGYPRPTWNISPQRFRNQLCGLLDRGFEAWSLNRLLHHRTQQKPLPPKVFAVTFDDAYESVYTRALPVLSELAIPATVFLATRYLDSPNVFPGDDWPARGRTGVPADSWRPLATWQVHRLLASGLIEIGAHTHTHGDFRNQPVALANDLQENLRCLRERFRMERFPFAFPYGNKNAGFHSARLVEVVRAAGFTCGLHTEPEPARIDSDPFDWGRFHVEPCDTAATLAGKISGWFTWWRARLGNPVAVAQTGRSREIKPSTVNAPTLAT